LDTGSLDALIVASCALKRLGLTDHPARTLSFSPHPLQGKLAVVCRSDRAEVRGLFRKIDARLSHGRDWPVPIPDALSGKRILYTGLDPSRADFSDPLDHVPFIRNISVKPPAIDPADYDAVLFTSRPAVEAYFSRFAVKGQKVLAIGRATADAAQAKGVVAEICGEEEDSDSLAEALMKRKDRAILYPCSNLSRNTIHDLPNVHPIVFYRTDKLTPPPLDLSLYSGIVFTSPSTVDAFLGNYENIPEHVICHVLGKKTAEALTRRGIHPWRIVIKGK
jgi:uroporphyrinogen-III synthase